MGDKLYIFTVFALVIGAALVGASSYNRELLKIGYFVFSSAFGLFIVSLFSFVKK